MAKAVGFEGANKVFQAPPSMDDCVDLEVFQDDSNIISCWRLSDEEIENVKKTGVVWLCITGSVQPPVFISGENFLEIDGKPSRAEPVLPKRKLQ